MALLEIIYSLLILSIPVGQILRLDTGDIGIVSSDVIAGVLLLYLIFTKRKLKGSLKIPIILVVLAMIISLAVGGVNLTTKESLISSLYILRFIAYSGIYFGFFYLNPVFVKRYFLKILIGSGFIFVLAGLSQILLYPSLRNLFYAGWDEHLYRFFSSLLDPNFSGALMVGFFLLLLGLYLSKEFVFRRSVMISLILLFFVSVFLTFSRSAYLMLLLGGLLLLFLKKRKIEAMLLVIVFSLFFVVFLNNKLFGEGTKLLRTASTSARISSMKKAFEVHSENPIFGVGYNSYRYSQEKHNFLKYRGYKIRSGAGTDNSFLFVLATTGIVGFFAYLYFVLKTFLLAKSGLSRGATLIAILGAITIGSLFNNLLFYPTIMLFVFSLLGLMEYK